MLPENRTEKREDVKLKSESLTIQVNLVVKIAEVVQGEASNGRLHSFLFETFRVPLLLCLPTVINNVDEFDIVNDFYRTCMT